jgi:hypothetical protein
MGPKKEANLTANLTDDLIAALRDERVLEALGAIMESRLQTVITELRNECTAQKKEVAELRAELESATLRIEALETYTRRDNLLITGLPVETYSDAVSSGQGESSLATEQSVLKLFDQQLGLNIQPGDISVAHRLPRKPNTGITGSQSLNTPTTIVKFTNRKARDTVFSARRKLKGHDIYINEDLNKKTSDLFRQARKLVKAKLIHNAWTSGCALYIKSTADPSIRPNKIITQSDLPMLPG